MAAVVGSTQHDVIIQYLGPGRNSFECAIKPRSFMVCHPCDTPRVTGCCPPPSVKQDLKKSLKAQSGELVAKDAKCS